MKRRLLALFSALALLLAACTGQPSGSPSQTQAATGPAVSSTSAAPVAPGGYNGPDKDIVTPKGQFPIVTKPVTLNVAVVQNAKISDFKDNDYTKFLEETTGVNMEFELLPSKEAKSKIKLLFASSDLPDVFSVGNTIDAASILEYSKDGMVLAIDEYVEHFGDEVYTMWETAEDKSLKSVMTAPDGHIYYLPKYSEQYINLYNYRAYVYGPWLEALGLEAATTTDEFTELLRAFKNNDPNGNGKNDEIPLIGFSQTDGYQPMLDFFLNAFVYWGQADRMYVENNTVAPAYTTDAFKDALMWLNSLINEGLLDPVTFTQDESQLKAIMNQDEMIVGVFAHYNRTGVLDTTGERSRAFVAQPPLTGPGGVCWSPATPPGTERAWVITNACETPAVAYRLGDFMLNEDVVMRGRYGVEGRDWAAITDPSKLGIDGKPAKFELLREVWQMPTHNVHWQWPNAGYMHYGVNESQLWSGDTSDYNYFQLQYGLNYIKGKQPAQCMPSQLSMNAEEMETYAMYSPAIMSYMRENTARFIVGDRSFDEWDAYVAEYDKMNLPKLVAVLQSVYDRMTAN